jgi:hypothetical protein
MDHSADSAPKLSLALAALAVLAPWMWMAVRSENCLRFLTGGRIPHTKRTIWLLKILAVIVGAGGVGGVVSDLGLRWYLAVLPSALVIYFGFTEKFGEIVPQTPLQDASAYHASWKIYWRLRRAYLRSWVWFGLAALATILVMFVAGWLSVAIRESLVLYCIVAVFVSLAYTGRTQWDFFRWPCPRCGCAFNGLRQRPWFRKNCAYCALPREANFQRHDFPITS